MANRSSRFLERSGSPAGIARDSRASLTAQFAGLSLVVLLAGCGGRAERSERGAGSASAASNAGGASGTGGASATGGTSEDGGSASETCAPGHAPLRMLTNAEYTRTVATLFGDDSVTTSGLPEEVRSFPVGSSGTPGVGLDQAKAYFQMAKEVAERVTRDSKALGALAPCAAAAQPEASCARTTIAAFAAKAFRRTPTEPELNELQALHTSIMSAGGNFVDATRAVIAAVLQGPDFLYRVEWGTDEGPRPDVRQLTGDEMATRLSYLFWGTSPDEGLSAAAQSGALLDPNGIAKQAARLFDDPRSHDGLAAFFDDFLELYRLPQLQRSDPAYSSAVGVALQEATQRFLESQIFEHDASWPAVLTSNKAFVNGAVSNLYGVVGITGDQWQEVSLDPTERRGLLTHPSSLMVGLQSDGTNPTQRGYRIMEKILCRDVPPEPPDLPALPTDPPANATTRQRWSQLTSSPVCAACHRDMDQLGYALEVFDSLGRYRTQENGLDIDTSVDVTGLGPTTGPVELVNKLAVLPETQACLAQRFAEFGLGKALAADPAGACLKQDIARRFEATGYNVRQLLLALTQTDAFLYLPKER